MNIKKQINLFMMVIFLFSFTHQLNASFPFMERVKISTLQSQEKEDYVLIQGLLRDELYDLAIKRIEGFLTSYPDSTNGEALHYKLGELYLNLQQFENAEKQFEAFVKKYLQSNYYQSAYFLLATAYQLDNKFSEAEKIYKDIIKQKGYQEDLISEAQERLSEIYSYSDRMQEAAVLLEKIIKNKPKIELKVKLANIYFELREIKEAKKLYESLINESSRLSSESIIRINYNLALIHYYNEDYDKAIQKFTSIHTIDPNHREAIIGLSWCYYQQKRYQEAYESLKSILERIDTTPSEDLLRQGEVFLLLHEYQAAINSFSQILERYPADPLIPQAYLGLGKSYLSQGKIKEAIKYFENFCSATHDNKAAYHQWYAIGEIYLNQLQDYNNAIRAYKKAIHLDEMAPLSDFALMKVINSHMKLQQYNDVVENIKLLVKKYPRSQYIDNSYYLLGKILTELDEPVKAIESYKVVVESFLDSEFREISQFNCGLLYFQMENWEQTIEEMSFLIKEFKKSSLYSKANYYISMSYYRLGNYQDGIKHFTNILQSIIDKDESQVSTAIFYIGWGYYKLHQYQQAEEYFTKLLNKYPDSVQAEEALYWLGWCYLAQEKYAESNQQFEKLISYFPKGEFAQHALWLMGNNYISLRDNSKAIGIFKQLIKEFPQSDSTLLADTKIEELYLQDRNYQELLNYLPEFAFNNPASYLSAEKQLAKADKLLTRGKKREAVRAYKQLISEFPRSPISDKANYNAAMIYYEQKNLNEAAIYLKNVVDYFPDSTLAPDSHHKLGNCYFQLEKFEEAIEQYKEIFEHPEYATIYDRIAYLVGYAYEQLKNIQQAAHYYKLYLANISEEDTMFKERVRLILFLQTLGEYEAAVNACQSILSSTNDDNLKAEVQFYIGECYRLWNKPEQSIIEYLKVTYLHSSNDMWALTARFKAGEIYQSLEKYDEAIKLYAKVAETYKGTKQGDFAQQRIEEINSLLYKKEKGEIKEEIIKP